MISFSTLNCKPWSWWFRVVENEKEEVVVEAENKSKNESLRWKSFFIDNINWIYMNKADKNWINSVTVTFCFLYVADDIFLCFIYTQRNRVCGTYYSVNLSR